MKINKAQNALLLTSIVLLFGSQAVKGQSTGTLKGSVSDHADAAIIWAEVTVGNGKERRQIKVDENGRYKIKLPEGEYVISSQARAFFPSKETKVKVTAGAITELKMALDVNLDHAECILKVEAWPQTPAKLKDDDQRPRKN